MYPQKPNKRLMLVFKTRLALCCLFITSLVSWLCVGQTRLKLFLYIMTMLFFMIMYFIYIPLSFKKLSYNIDTESFSVSYGVIYNTTATIPIDNIQFVSAVQLPLDRVYNLYNIRAVCAGGQIFFSGLDKERAMALKALLGGES